MGLFPPLHTIQPGEEPTPTKQPFWGDTISGKALDNSAANSGGADAPYWEAPFGQWSQWDIATIAGTLVPGLVTVNMRKRCRVQQKRTPGASGATPTLLGFDPAEIDLEIQMWTPAQFAQFENLVHGMKATVDFAMRLSTPDAKRRACAFDVQHPGLAMYGIRSLLFLEFTIPKRTSLPGVFSATIRFAEFTPLTKDTGPNTVNASKADNNFTPSSINFGQATSPTPVSQQSGASDP